MTEPLFAKLRQMMNKSATNCWTWHDEEDFNKQIDSDLPKLFAALDLMEEALNTISSGFFIEKRVAKLAEHEANRSDMMRISQDALAKVREME